ncbi:MULTISPECIES: type II secretion system F family protein [unclassified Streptomyces]|uniref:type II secretion system F family protein n=1 Tax=unclassified Streptomyces TaxID=2593676 RepID=UPI000BF90D8B|nr:type II secretion system F family protein [Streptomyces sp. Ru87]PGH49604.1 type II secretion protein F [Streptomyces sp. Ru87]
MSAQGAAAVPSLWTVLGSAVAVTATVCAVRDARRGRTVRGRLVRLCPAGPSPGRCAGISQVTGGRFSALCAALRGWWPAVGTGLAVAALVGGVAGCVAAVAVGYGVRIRTRSLPARRPPWAEEADRLPLAADLLAACLAAGAGPREAAQAVGGSLGGPLGERLIRVAAELRLGAGPEAAWGRFGELPGAEPLARCLERAQSTGAPAVEPVTRLAADCRAERARAATAAARRAGVLATAPLGLCFLPAFLTIGVAPVLIGLAGQLLSGA